MPLLWISHLSIRLQEHTEHVDMLKDNGFGGCITYALPLWGFETTLKFIRHQMTHFFHVFFRHCRWWTTTVEIIFNALSTSFEEVNPHFDTPVGKLIFPWCCQQADLCQGPKKVRDPGFAESKVWDLDGSWTLHVLFAAGLWKPRTSKLCYAASKTLETQDLNILICSETLKTQDLKILIVSKPWKPRTLKFGYVAKPWKPRTQNFKKIMSGDLKILGPYNIQYRISC